MLLGAGAALAQAAPDPRCDARTSKVIVTSPLPGSGIDRDKLPRQRANR